MEEDERRTDFSVLSLSISYCMGILLCSVPGSGDDCFCDVYIHPFNYTKRTVDEHEENYLIEGILLFWKVGVNLLAPWLFYKTRRARKRDPGSGPWFRMSTRVSPVI